MSYFIHLLLAICLTSLSVTIASAQTQDRRLIFDRLCNDPAVESKDEDSDCLVELIDIQIGSQKITSGKPFVADENWIKNLKVRIRNISGKPFVFVGVSFGLIEGMYENLAPSASWGWAFGFYRGKASTPYGENRKVSKVVVLAPNKELELTFDNLPKPNKKSRLLEVSGKMRQIVFITARVEFKGGKHKDSYLFIRKQK